MAFQFPWTNLHELNLDWFLSKFKQFTNNYLETTATVELIPTTEQPEVTVTGGTLDDDTDIVDPFIFNFKLPINTSGGGAVNSVNGMVGDVVLDKTDIGLGNVANVTQYSASNPPPYPVTSVNGMTGDVIVQGANGNYAPAIISSASGTIAHFTDGADNIPVNDLTIGIDPAQSGSGDPAPDNIRTISGWTGANVTRCGANILDIDDWAINPNVPMTISNGIITLSNSGFQEGNNKYIIPNNSIYTLSFHVKTIALNNASATFATYFDGVKTVGKTGTTPQGNIALASVGNEKDVVYTVTGKSEISFGGWAYGGTVEISNIQLEQGTKATLYVPYSPTTVAISWQTEAGIVYGGSLNVATGVLTVDRAITDLGNKNFTKGNRNTDNTGYIFYFSDTTYKNLSEIISSQFKTVYNIPNWEALPVNCCNSAGGSYFLFCADYPDATTFKTAMSGVQLCYELATPQTYQLTPQQLFNTLYGVNNIWSDTGDSTITYTADTMLYIQNLTQPTEDDMVANTAIANGKFFMIGNNLYRATTAIASGSQIIPGTNATPMSLADALNLL